MTATAPRSTCTSGFGPDADPEDLAHFLGEAGFLHLTGVFTEEEMATISADMDAAFPQLRARRRSLVVGHHRVGRAPGRAPAALPRALADHGVAARRTTGSPGSPA